MRGAERIGDMIGRRSPETANALEAARDPGAPEAAARAVLIGFPSDEGVRRNGGRTGASLAPAEIRRRLCALGPDPRRPAAFTDLLRSTADLGDVDLCGRVEEDQEILGSLLAPRLQAGAFAIVLGGGHETAFGHFLAHAQTGRSVEILNWDAHTDVRPPRGGKAFGEGGAHSGSPFRQALLHAGGGCRRYTVAGLLRHAVESDHLRFVEEHGGRFVWGCDLTPAAARDLYASLEGPAMVSFDLDAVDAAFAPGVSAPATGGMDPRTWLAAAHEAGRCPRVLSADIVELNPRYDVDGRTARLAALTVWHVLRGLAERREG